MSRKSRRWVITIIRWSDFRQESNRTVSLRCCLYVFFFNDPATTEIYTLSLHDALPISLNLSLSGVNLVFEHAHIAGQWNADPATGVVNGLFAGFLTEARAQESFLPSNLGPLRSEEHTSNSSHSSISYAVFCLKKKKKQ